MQVDVAALRTAILALPDVSGVHELHVWQLGSDDATSVGTVHVTFSSARRVNQVIAQVRTGTSERGPGR